MRRPLQLLILVSALLSQKQAAAEELICGMLPLDGTAYAVKDVELRDQPEQNASVVKKLASGAALSLKHPQPGLDEWHSADGAPIGLRFCNNQWFEVSGTDKPIKWIPGQALALSSLQLNRALLLAAAGSKNFELIVLKGDKEVARSALTQVSAPQAMPGYTLEFSSIGNKGLGKNVEAVLVKLIYEACGYLNPEVLVVWNGSNLIIGPSAENMSEAGIFNVTSTFIFPTDPGGERDVVTIERVERTDFDGSRYIKETKIRSRYTWTGTSFEMRQ